MNYKIITNLSGYLQWMQLCADLFGAEMPHKLNLKKHKSLQNIKDHFSEDIEILVENAFYIKTGDMSIKDVKAFTAKAEVQKISAYCSKQWITEGFVIKSKLYPIPSSIRIQVKVNA